MISYGRLLRTAVGGLLVLGAVGPDARAELRFAEPVVRLGEIKAGAPLTRDFAFTNTGPEKVELLEAHPSCGCLVPRLEQRLFQPGEKGAIRLDINTLGQPPGPHTWQLHVRIRRGESVEETILEVTAQIVVELSVSPAALAFFANGPLSLEVTLTDQRAQPLQQLEVRTTSSRIQATLLGTTRDPADHQVFRVGLAVAADCPDGRFEETLDLFTTDPLYRHLQVPVTVVHGVRERLSVLPAEVAVRAAPSQPIPSQLLRIRDADDRPVLIESITADNPAIQCRWAAGPGNCATVRVLLDRERLSGNTLQSSIHIRLAVPAQQTLSVPVSCTVE